MRTQQNPRTVRKIRRLVTSFPQWALAIAFGTCQSNISQIANRVTWRDVR
jgi:hypothetical protein